MPVTIPKSGGKKDARHGKRSVLSIAVLVIIAGLFLAACSPALTYAGSTGAVRNDASRGGKAVLVVIDRIGLNDIMDASPPNIDYLIS
ncbi:MAG: hypothetical protein MUP40_03305, partial [Actinobacteria bacterium]|nr:hypothetical protein [Actinomycetota bacterium]